MAGASADPSVSAILAKMSGSGARSVRKFIRIASS